MAGQIAVEFWHMAGNTAAIGVNAMGCPFFHAGVAALAEFVGGELGQGFVNGFCLIFFMNVVAVYANYASLGMLALLPLVVLQIRCLILGVFDIVIVEGFPHIITVREGVTGREALLMRR